MPHWETTTIKTVSELLLVGHLISVMPLFILLQKLSVYSQFLSLRVAVRLGRWGTGVPLFENCCFSKKIFSFKIAFPSVHG
jgi:hypothetical protein